MRWISYVLWPALMVTCIGITASGLGSANDLLYFNAAYLLMALTLLLFEWKTPHEVSWQRGDGQTLANIAHTLTSKGVLQGMLFFSAYLGLANLVTPLGAPNLVTPLGAPSLVTPLGAPSEGYWPRQWPLWAQAGIGLVIAELPLYWAHRLSHEWLPLWRFHAIHHSVTRLWILNTGRFHFVDSLLSVVAGAGLLIALGAPMEVLKWLGAITAFIGMLTHCNVQMRFGPLSWLFNTPELHRWHHSRLPAEGNSNYCQNIMLWDLLFGTYFRPQRSPPANIGIDEPMPAAFLQQLLYPLRRPAHQREHATAHTDDGLTNR